MTGENSTTPSEDSSQTTGSVLEQCLEIGRLAEARLSKMTLRELMPVLEESDFAELWPGLNPDEPIPDDYKLPPLKADGSGQ